MIIYSDVTYGSLEVTTNMQVLNVRYLPQKNIRTKTLKISKNFVK